MNETRPDMESTAEESMHQLNLDAQKARPQVVAGPLAESFSAVNFRRDNPGVKPNICNGGDLHPALQGLEFRFWVEPDSGKCGVTLTPGKHNQLSDIFTRTVFSSEQNARQWIALAAESNKNEVK